MYIVKRDGRKVDFDPTKIAKAIEKAASQVGETVDENVIERIAAKVKSGMSVEKIQDLVVRGLINTKFKNVGIAYIEHRSIRNYERLKAAEGILKRMGDIVDFGDNENSNKNYQLPSVIRDTIAGEYFRNKIFKMLNPIVAKAHRDKAIHWHDSDVDPKLTNCCIFDIKDMLENGTRVTNADIEQPKSVGVAMNVAMQIMASISASQYGGVSLPEFNEVFAEYAKMNFKKNFLDYCDLLHSKEPTLNLDFRISSDNKELEDKYPRVFKKAKEKTKKDIYDACQTFEYQTNSILGSASQTPFSTITFSIPTSWESETIMDSYLDVRMKGLGERGIIAIFPKISMIVVDGYNLRKDDPYYYLREKASKCIAKTYYPDVLNYSKEEYDAGRYYARMGCRSRVNHEYVENGSPVRMGRFNYGVVTNNLVHYALQSNGDFDKFIDLIQGKSREIMKLALMERYRFVSQLKAKEAPILFQYGGISRLEPEETIAPLLKTDKASVSYGFIGVDDCVRVLTGNKENISTELGFNLGMEIMKTISNEAKILKEETGLPVSLYGTPAEAGIHTMFQRDLELFGDVMPNWLKDRGYYTNSFHFSSELPIDAFDKIDIEAQLLQYSNGGNISYVENSGKVQNSEAIMELMEYAYDAGTQYFAVNTVSDVCYKCGFVGEIEYNEDTANYKCPHCGNTDGRDMKVQRRSCGYISNYNITHAVKGRMKEIKNRFKHV